MNESQGNGLRTGTNEGEIQPQSAGRNVERVIRAIEDSLIETLGSDLALAVRVCLKTSVVLSDPLAYASALEVMLGNEKAERVLSCVGRRLRDLETDLGPASWRSFAQSIVALRNQYSLEIIRNSK